MSTEIANAPTAQMPREDDAEVCELCFGTGVQAVPNKGARPCPECSKNAGQSLLDAARIPHRYAGCTLDNFKCANNSQEIALQYARCLVRDYPHIDRGLLYMGPVGVGKTHLAVAILKGLIERGRPGLFYEFGSLLKQIQASYNPVSDTSELEVLAPVFQTEVLVLDELGASKPTDWVRDTLYQIINTRYNDKKLTIFTTNRLDEAQAERADTDDSTAQSINEWKAQNRGRTNKNESKKSAESLEERIGFPLRSRLYAMCNTSLILGKDYRKRLDKRQF